jgi:DNA-binding transcriptional LysR family regulator
MDPSLVGLRVLREVAERGSLTAAAAALGYTQSAVSRQIATLERAAGAKLLDRRPDGVRLTPAGRVLLRHAVVALDELGAAGRELQGQATDGGIARLGYLISAGGVLVPRSLAALRRRNPDIEVTTREGTTPSLIRALRARTIDLALLSSRVPYRPPDEDDPPLLVEPLAEAKLLLAVPADSSLGKRKTIHIDELADQRWIASASRRDEPLLGVWPGMAGRPRIVHSARDWLTKLSLVAAGCGVTTVAALLAPVIPEGVRLLEVNGGPDERRRLTLAQLPEPASQPVNELAATLHQEADQL